MIDPKFENVQNRLPLRPLLDRLCDTKAEVVYFPVRHHSPAGAALVNMEKIRSDKADIGWSMTTVMSDAQKGEAGGWSIYWEGTDNDADGRTDYTTSSTTRAWRCRGAAAGCSSRCGGWRGRSTRGSCACRRTRKAGCARASCRASMARQSFARKRAT